MIPFAKIVDVEDTTDVADVAILLEDHLGIRTTLEIHFGSEALHKEVGLFIVFSTLILGPGRGGPRREDCFRYVFVRDQS